MSDDLTRQVDKIIRDGTYEDGFVKPSMRLDIADALLAEQERTRRAEASLRELRTRTLAVLEPIVDRINANQLDALDEFLDALRKQV